MIIYELVQEQFLPVSVEEAWEFFSNPSNLNEITPDDLGFEITAGSGRKMFTGQIITYRIALLPGIKTTWVTEIKAVENGKIFIDEQRFGPYKFWYHRHEFERAEQGVKMRDHIHYALPFGILGRIAHATFVKRKLRKIFSYRYKWLADKFGTLEN